MNSRGERIESAVQIQTLTAASIPKGKRVHCQSLNVFKINRVAGNVAVGMGGGETGGAKYGQFRKNVGIE
jgi:hypothetical protein